MKRSLSILLTVTLLLSGCGLVADREYRSVDFHVHGGDTEAAVDSIGSYDALVRALTAQVRRAQPKATLTFTNYAGDLRGDLTRACYSVSTEIPIGAYAVDYISFDEKIVYAGSNAHTTVFFKYKHSVEKIESVAYVSTRDFGSVVDAALASYTPQIVIETGYFNPAEARLQDRALQLFLQEPLWGVDIPEVTAVTYPANGVSCVVEISFLYTVSGAELFDMSRLCREGLSRLQPETPPTQDPAAQCFILAHLLCDGLAFDGKAVALDRMTVYDTAYGALAVRRATSLGTAMAFKAMCDNWDLVCHVVLGTYNGAQTAWNLVMADGAWRHIDVGAVLRNGAHAALLTDSEMTEYDWEPNDYPAAVIVDDTEEEENP
jgi:hypothetical protein